MEEIAVNLVEHGSAIGTVIAAMLLIFMALVTVVIRVAKMELEKVKVESNVKITSIENQFRLDMMKLQNDIEKNAAELTGVKDSLHRLNNAVNNGNANIKSISHQMALILVKLGADPVKMAQDE